MSKKVSIKFQYVDFDKLVFLENNPRTRSDKGLETMAADIKADPTFYENRPTLVNFTNGEFRVYAGDLRAHAAHDKLGWSQVPCNVEADVPQKTMERRAILDNTHREGWDSDELANWDFEIEELEEMGVPSWVFGGKGLSEDEMAAFFEKDNTKAVCGKMKIVLEYTEDDFRVVKEALLNVAKTPEQAVWKLLNFGE